MGKKTKNIELEVFLSNRNELFKKDVIEFLLVDGFSQKQIVNFFSQNKKYEPKIFAYHVKRIAEMSK